LEKRNKKITRTGTANFQIVKKEFVWDMNFVPMALISMRIPVKKAAAR
jgi:hypothetical protein